MILRYTFRLFAIALLISQLALVGSSWQAPASAPQSTAPQSTDARRVKRPTSTPYTGDLSIFDYPEGDQNLQINRVMDLLKIKEGSVVADIGAGSGWFTVRAARRVDATGKVYAVEINPRFLKHIERRAADENLVNIQTVLGKEDDPLLPPDSVDAVLILKTYHEIAQPVLLLSHLRQSLKAEALLGIIDKNGNGKDHGISKRTVINEAKDAGYSLVDEYDFVKPDGMDYFLVFRINTASAAH